MSKLKLNVESGKSLLHVKSALQFFFLPKKLARFPNILELMLHCSANPKVLTPCHGSPDNAKKTPHFENQKKELPKANFSKNASHSRALWHTRWWVLQFRFEVHYVFFFGGFKHEPKYVKIETSARLTVLFLWRKAIIR